MHSHIPGNRVLMVVNATSADTEIPTKEPVAPEYTCLGVLGVHYFLDGVYGLSNLLTTSPFLISNFSIVC